MSVKLGELEDLPSYSSSIIGIRIALECKSI